MQVVAGVLANSSFAFWNFLEFSRIFSIPVQKSEMRPTMCVCVYIYIYRHTYIDIYSDIYVST